MGKAARRVCWDVKKQSGYRGLGTEGRMVGPSHTGRTYMLSKVRGLAVLAGGFHAGCLELGGLRRGQGMVRG
jgi:hypothetical protein